MQILHLSTPLFWQIPTLFWCFNFYCYCNISVKKDEVENLLAMFEANAKNEKMDRSKFRDILYKQFELTEDILMDRGK